VIAIRHQGYREVVRGKAARELQRMRVGNVGIRQSVDNVDRAVGIDRFALPSSMRARV
jgi:hypothetical protein